VKRIVLAVLLVAACGGEEDELSSSIYTLESDPPTLNTFIQDAIQIDDLDGSGDANLFLGDDPADGSASVDLPASARTFIDWNDLDPSQHVLRDLDGDDGRDHSSFPQSNECVNSSKVLSKMDLTYVASANNHEYAYFLVQRSANNGDAGYYWLFTKKPPKMIMGGGPCKASQAQLLYDISGPGPGGGGDILLGGHFSPSGGPLLTVYRAAMSQDDVPATDAIDFEGPLWAPDATGIANAVVNTTITDPGVLGSEGVKSMSGSALGEELIAEAAVPLSVFTSGSACGATFYGSVITRPSGSGGTSPDLKDLAGPALFNFGSTEAHAELTGSCDLTLGYSAGATGPDGEPVAGATCEWEFSDGSTASGCAGVKPASPGVHSATVVVSDATSACVDDADAGSATVYAPLSISLDLDDGSLSCPMDSDAVTYTANVSGGTGASSVSWTGASCAGASCTLDPSDSDFCASYEISATVSDDLGLCASATSETETYSKQTTVNASNN
jgi:hypothetical protein